jgi:hypothetical protein
VIDKAVKIAADARGWRSQGSTVLVAGFVVPDHLLAAPLDGNGSPCPGLVHLH